MTKPSDASLRLAFLLVPQFSLMSFSAALEPLRAANRLSARTPYVWEFVSVDGQPVMASNAIPVAVQSSLEELKKPDMLVVCAGLEPLQYAGQRALLGRLRTLSGHGTRIGAISSGSFILADAGLLSGRRCTVHWEYAELFRLRYPRLELTDELYVVESNVFTCSGGTAALDLMLHFITEQCGAELALAVADQFIHPHIREHDSHQRMEAHVRYRLSNPKLVKFIHLIEQALEEPLDLEAYARRVGLSTRQIERLFRRHIGTSPGRFHLDLRLARSRTLLLQTPQSVGEIALECGFESTPHFCRVYKKTFGRTPSEERRPSRALRLNG